MISISFDFEFVSCARWYLWCFVKMNFLFKLCLYPNIIHSMINSGASSNQSLADPAQLLLFSTCCLCVRTTASETLFSGYQITSRELYFRSPTSNWVTDTWPSLDSAIHWFVLLPLNLACRVSRAGGGGGGTGAVKRTNHTWLDVIEVSHFTATLLAFKHILT